MSAECVCDYDSVGDPLRFVRCNKAALCPVHDECEVCEAALATSVIDGEKVCDVCSPYVNEDEALRVHEDFQHVDAEAWRTLGD